MRKIYLDKNKIDPKSFFGRYAKNTDFDLVINDDCIVYDSDTKEILVAFYKKAIPADVAKKVYPALMRGLKYVTNNRGKYSGLKGEDAKKISVRSYASGYFDRQGGRHPACRATQYTRENPGAWKRQIPLLEIMCQKIKQDAPQKYSNMVDFVSKIRPEYKEEGVVLTTTAVNISTKAGYHRDAGDYKDGLGGIAVFMKGQCIDWKLVFSEYRVAVNLRDRDLIIFNPHLMHATTEGYGKGEVIKDWNRISVVGYTRQGLSKCLPFEQEIQRARENYG